MNEILLVLLSAILNGLMLFLGIYLGTKMSARAIRKEVESLLHKFLLELRSSRDFENFLVLLKKGREVLESEEAKRFFDELTRTVIALRKLLIGAE